MATRFELWKQALEQLRDAEAQLDQAHATLRDIGLHQERATGLRQPHVGQLVSDTESLIELISEYECDECGHAVARHGDRYGCEYERGDVSMNTRDGGTVEAACGPCGCEHWSKQNRTSPATPVQGGTESVVGKIETERSMSRSIAPSDDHRSDQRQVQDIRSQSVVELIDRAENLDGPEVDVCRAACLQQYLEQMAFATIQTGVRQ